MRDVEKLVLRAVIGNAAVGRDQTTLIADTAYGQGELLVSPLPLGR